MTQKKASPYKGNPIRRNLRESLYEGRVINSPQKTAPINVLPTSPMNIFAGDQFQIRKPKIAPDKAQQEVDAISKTPHPATSPSRPSMKFVKLITAVMVIINKTPCQIEIVNPA